MRTVPPEPPAGQAPHSCAACRIAATLTEHRDACAADWSHRRGTLNFAILIAQQECPEHKRAWAVDA
jgi:hypothetical protein